MSADSWLTLKSGYTMTTDRFTNKIREREEHLVLDLLLRENNEISVSSIYVGLGIY